jgi:hypothetical protein
MDGIADAVKCLFPGSSSANLRKERHDLRKSFTFAGRFEKRNEEYF